MAAAGFDRELVGAQSSRRVSFAQNGQAPVFTTDFV
jgi:hypothetical protein